MSYDVIFATKNKGKIREINAILEDTGLHVVSQEEAGVFLDVVEDGTTFEENAIKKAKEIMEATGKVALADDSGLEVDYLDKAPGVYSARFGGVDTSYRIKNQMIINALENAKQHERTARFVSVIAAAFPDGRIETTRGTIEGVIDYEEKGENGFGYDPIFYVPEYHMTTGEMAPELKNQISHRGKALTAMKPILAAYFNKN